VPLNLFFYVKFNEKEETCHFLTEHCCCFFRNKREKTPVSGIDKFRKQESVSSIPSSKKNQAPQLPTIEKTVFFLPGVDVKVLFILKF
jgi:hypothetical protein